MGSLQSRASVKSDATVRGVRLGAITGAYGPFPTEPGQDGIDVIVQKSKYNWENPHSHIIVKVSPGAADPPQSEPGTSRVALPTSWVGKVGTGLPLNRVTTLR